MEATMKTPRHRRSFAAVCVIATVAGTAYAQLSVTPQTASTNMGTIPQNTPGRVVFSIRNTSTSSVAITGFAPQGGAGCTGVTINPSTATLMPNQQQQFVATTSGFNFSPAVCTWNISSTPSSGATVSTSFSTALVASPADVQPTQMDFGSQFAAGESQDVTVSSYGTGGSGYAMISNDPANKFRFDESVCGTGNFHNCMIAIPTSGNTVSLAVNCNPQMITGTPANVSIYGGSGFGSGFGSQLLGQVALSNCIAGNAIQFENAPMTIVTNPNTTGSGSAHIISLSGMGNLDSASLVTGDSNFKINDCGLQTCTFTNRSLDTFLSIECVGTTAGTTAQLMVYGSGVGSDSGTITCVSTGSTGILTALPNPLPFGQVDVNPNPAPIDHFTLYNMGGSTVSGVTVSPPMNTTDWSVSGCSSLSPCSIGAGSSQDIDVTFHPTTHGDKTTNVTVSATGPGIPFMVSLTGEGMGGVMSVAQPQGPPYVLDFGTIPRGQPFTRTLSLSNIGNKTFTANVSTPSSPYAITPMASQLITPLAQKDYTVTCESPTASASNDQTLSITSTAYANGSASVSLKCAIADTVVQVSPQQFDFGEVRTGTARRELSVTVTNPAGAAAAAHVTSMQLHEPRTGLSLQPAMTDKVLQPGESVSATLVLTTEEDSDLSGELLDITVDSAMLSLPVTGKVVTARSSLTPDAIDLGTACVGSLVSADVTLRNEGTATLQVERPMMDATFVASVSGAMTFPTPLPPAQELHAVVEPAVTTVGSASGTLTWDDDVPNHYMVPAKVEYITTGTALSPALLDFGSIAVDAAGFPKRVTVENCDLEPTDITIKAITTQNSPVGAWQLEPRLGTKKTLPPHDKQAITVTFRPPARGRYEADLEVETSFGPRRIHLRGDAVGRDFDNTSFYACSCSSLSPGKSWPIFAAVLFIIFRRRRGSSSAR
ncbi:MAG TPA: choice-of-anchor D domain-containing protein [Kofleriaceae bacterium]|nr:choice-of-anchor D domain-containing protein [Kofleriaceae bacterium]